MNTLGGFFFLIFGVLICVDHGYKQAHLLIYGSHIEGKIKSVRTSYACGRLITDLLCNLGEGRKTRKITRYVVEYGENTGVIRGRRGFKIGTAVTVKYSNKKPEIFIITTQGFSRPWQFLILGFPSFVLGFWICLRAVKETLAKI